MVKKKILPEENLPVSRTKDLYRIWQCPRCKYFHWNREEGFPFDKPGWCKRTRKQRIGLHGEGDLDASSACPHFVRDKRK